MLYHLIHYITFLTKSAMVSTIKCYSSDHRFKIVNCNHKICLFILQLVFWNYMVYYSFIVTYYKYKGF